MLRIVNTGCFVFIYRFCFERNAPFDRITVRRKKRTKPHVWYSIKNGWLAFIYKKRVFTTYIMELSVTHRLEKQITCFYFFCHGKNEDCILKYLFWKGKNQKREVKKNIGIICNFIAPRGFLAFGMYLYFFSANLVIFYALKKHELNVTENMLLNWIKKIPSILA